MKNYRLWAKVSAGLMLFTGVVHSLSLFVQATPQNEPERQMLELITTYRMDAGAGFHPSYSNLFTALSSCFSLLCFLGGITVFYLIRKGTSEETMRGLLNIHIAIFGVCFAMMAYFTFLPPIVCTGLIFVTLIVARIGIKTPQAPN
ncbi:MAG: hypothetical protein IPN69_06430 [Acidobacteria bacterium]|nr:hypothetical protein [Acidobacteriota bacterium]MBK8810358.1 hypothetical protein [Acidobacteriota bacterium]